MTERIATGRAAPAEILTMAVFDHAGGPAEDGTWTLPPEVARMLRDFTLDALMLVVGVLREAGYAGARHGRRDEALTTRRTMPAAELSVANHPHHDATGCIADALGDDGVDRPRNHRPPRGSTWRP